MNVPVSKELTRREILSGGVLLGAAAVLSACQGTGSSQLPGPVWPDGDRVATGEGSGPISSPSPRVKGSVSLPPVPGVSSIPSGVIPRSAWTGSQPKWGLALPMNGVQYITVHHTAVNSSGLYSQSSVARELESIRQSHLRRGSEWLDIGYHYLIDPQGRIWQGRPVSIEGAHVAKTNPHNLGIACLGNFDEQTPTPAQLSALDSFVASQMKLYRVSLGHVYTHQELKPTACPGRSLQRHMQSARARGGRIAMA